MKESGHHSSAVWFFLFSHMSLRTESKLVAFHHHGGVVRSRGPYYSTKTEELSSSAKVSSSTSSSSAVAASTQQQLPQTVPLAPHTFAGKVEQALLSGQFGGGSVDRVLESWRLMEQDYEYRAYVGPTDGDPAVSNCHQHCTSYVPGLTVRQFWDTDQFDWCLKLANKYKAIKSEFMQVTADLDRQIKQGNNIWARALTEDASKYGDGWRTLVLMDRGIWDPVNTNLFPVTAKAIRDCNIPAVEVFFTSLQARTSIQPHSDFVNFVLTSHLALDIPYSGENKCQLTIGDETRQWMNGELLIFDTSLRHAAVNDSDKTRYVLMMRIWHPDLTMSERRALQFIFDCLNQPDLVSDDPQVREKAKKEMELLQEFPKLYSSPGFGGTGGARKNAKSKKR